MRKTIQWNDGWSFVRDDIGLDGAMQLKDGGITLPHTWNAKDGQDGGNDYYRGTCWYTKQFAKPEFGADEELWLEFSGAAMTAEVFLNGTKLARHEGGYSTFRVNLTEHLTSDNVLCVSVDNGVNRTVYPQKADFTFYGGIYRDVNLLIVPKEHFALDYFGCNGIKVTTHVADNLRLADIQVETWQTKDVPVIIELAGEIQTVNSQDGYASATFHIVDPHLWNGKQDPYLYKVTAKLLSGDMVSASIGCRRIEFNAEKGFILNNVPTRLCGAARHQDRQGIGNALTKAEHEEDMEILLDMGQTVSVWPITSMTSIFMIYATGKGLLSGQRSHTSQSICPKRGKTL